MTAKVTNPASTPAPAPIPTSTPQPPPQSATNQIPPSDTATPTPQANTPPPPPTKAPTPAPTPSSSNNNNNNNNSSNNNVGSSSSSSSVSSGGSSSTDGVNNPNPTVNPSQNAPPTLMSISATYSSTIGSSLASSATASGSAASTATGAQDDSSSGSSGASAGLMIGVMLGGTILIVAFIVLIVRRKVDSLRSNGWSRRGSRKLLDTEYNDDYTASQTYFEDKKMESNSSLSSPDIAYLAPLSPGAEYHHNYQGNRVSLAPAVSQRQSIFRQSTGALYQPPTSLMPVNGRFIPAGSRQSTFAPYPNYNPYSPQ